MIFKSVMCADLVFTDLMLKSVGGDRFDEHTDLVINWLLDRFEDISDLKMKSVIGDQFDVHIDLVSNRSSGTDLMSWSIY